MGRGIERLSSIEIRNATAPGVHPDGGGLNIQVGKFGARSWLLRYMLRGKARAMGLGSLNTVSVGEARALALGARKLLAQGLDPLEVRNQDRARRTAEEAAKVAASVTFRHAAAQFIAGHQAGWKDGGKSAGQWLSSLKMYAYPTLGDLVVGDITDAHLISVVEPIWATKNETASRLRGRIEQILDFASGMGWRPAGDNPARLKGTRLGLVLPKRSRVQKVVHHRAIPYRDVPAFMRRLETHLGGSVAALALRFLILTACRTSEVIGASWPEIDGSTWSIDGSRMKAGKMHRVPLPALAIEVLDEAARLRQSQVIFPGKTRSGQLSNMAMAELMKGMGIKVTVHGFRSAFRDWAGEETRHPTDVIEAALAHMVGNKVQLAYQRGDLFDKRLMLMNDWARFCGFSVSPTDQALVTIQAAK